MSEYTRDNAYYLLPPMTDNTENVSGTQELGGTTQMVVNLPRQTFGPRGGVGSKELDGNARFQGVGGILSHPLSSHSFN